MCLNYTWGKVWEYFRELWKTRIEPGALTLAVSALPPELWPPGDCQPSQFSISLRMCRHMYMYFLPLPYMPVDLFWWDFAAVADSMVAGFCGVHSAPSQPTGRCERQRTTFLMEVRVMYMYMYMLCIIASHSHPGHVCANLHNERKQPEKRRTS